MEKQIELILNTLIMGSCTLAQFILMTVLLVLLSSIQKMGI